MKIKKNYFAKYLHAYGDCLIFDLSRNMAGLLEFEVKGKTGDVIDVFPAEKLDLEGNVDQFAKGWGMIDTSETYIIGRNDVWETA